MTPEKKLEIMGMKIKTARLEAGMTSAAFARKIGTNRETMRFIEAGNENPKIKLLFAIQEELKIDDLFPNATTK